MKIMKYEWNDKKMKILKKWRRENEEIINNMKAVMIMKY